MNEADGAWCGPWGERLFGDGADEGPVEVLCEAEDAGVDPRRLEALFELLVA